MRIRKPIIVGLGALVMAVVATLTIVIVTSGSDEPARPAAEQPKGPNLAPLKLSDKPLWTIEEAQANVAMRDGVLLSMDFHTDNLTLSELATGAPRWTLESLPDGGSVDGSYNEVPLFVGHGDGLGVLVPYRDFTNETVEAGLALLSAKDGSLRWKTPVSSGDGLVHRLWTADDHTALVNMFPISKVTDLGQIRAVAIDVATGTTRWERPGLWPYEIAGDTVVGEESAHTIVGRGRYGHQPLAKLVAVDVATGENRWDLSGRYARSNLLGTGGDLVVARGVGDKPNSDKRYPVLAAATGRELFQLDARIDSCADDGRQLIACARMTTTTNTLTTIRIDDRKITTTKRDIPDLAGVEGVWQGRIMAYRYEQGKTVHFSVDQAGHLIDAELPGRILGLSDQFAVCWAETSDRLGEYAVYRVTS